MTLSMSSSAISTILTLEIVSLYLEINFDLPVVELQILDGFTLFDWCKVLERAKKIYTVNTAINYIIDVLDTSYDEYVIYAHDEENKTQIDYLFNKPHTMLCRS